MSKTIKNINKTVKITNNTQRVGAKLLSADGGWLTRGQLNRIPSATARARDLRKKEYGGFKVECKSSTELGRKLSKKTFYYRIDPSNVTTKQINQLFGD